MDEIVNTSGQVKIEEAASIGDNRESKVKIENSTEHGSLKDLGVPQNNENGNLSVNCDSVTNGHRPVIAQVAPMTSIIRRSVEELRAFNAVQTSAPIDKLALSQATKQEHDVQPNANFAVTSAPLTVNLAVSREISGNAVESSSGDYTTPASDSVHIKRPMNAFLIWSTARRHQIKIGEPNITMAEISKRLGEEWKNMGFEERQPFVDRSKQLREEHMARYPNYKYQPRRRKLTNNPSTNLSTAATGKIKSIKSTPRLNQQSMTSSCDTSLHQSPQQDLNQQSQIQIKSYQHEPSSYHPDHIAMSHSPPRPASSSQTVHQYNHLQQPQQASSSEILGQHSQQQQQQQQLVAINTSTPLPQNQLPQQQLIQPVNDNLITASTVQVNQWPATIYPGLTLMGYHMTSNGMVPLYAPTQPMLPLISLPTATVGSVIQQRNSATGEATLEEQQNPSQSQPKQSDNQQQSVLGMYTLTGSDRSIATMDLANEVKVSLTNSDSVSAERKGPLETPATKDIKAEDICESRTREVVSFTQI